MSNLGPSFKEAFANRHEPANLRLISEAYWRALLLIALIALVGVIGFGLWQFSAVMKKISTENISAATAKDAVDKQKLEQVIILYQAQLLEYESAKRTKPVVTDPTK
jgi:hypothetical protein